MSNSQWQEHLRQKLRNLAQDKTSPRVAVIGVGNELRSDDALGVYLARALKSYTDTCEHVLALEAGLAPENFCGTLRRFRPDLVILIDAAQMGEEPGTVQMLDLQSAVSLTISAHDPSFQLFAKYLDAELGCELAILGVQVADLSFDAPISHPVRKAIGVITAMLVDLFEQARLVGKTKEQKDKSAGEQACILFA